MMKISNQSQLEYPKILTSKEFANESDSDEEELLKEFQRIKEEREQEEKIKLDLDPDHIKEQEKEIMEGNKLIGAQDYILKKKFKIHIKKGGTKTQYSRTKPEQI